MAIVMNPVFQASLPYDIHAPRPLPGITPLAQEDWLIADDAFAGQMAIRDTLLRDRRTEVLQIHETAHEASIELLDLVLELAYANHRAGRQVVTRPDAVTVSLNRDDPLATLGRLVQEDFCILQKHGGEHVLTGAVLCFPASWTLSEKFMRPLAAIHAPVNEYDDQLAKRVQRLFDGVRVGRAMWRFNALWYDDPDLFQPRQEADPRATSHSDQPPYLRSERQSILRLPRSDAVVFSIHSFVLKRADVPGTPL